MAVLISVNGEYRNDNAVSNVILYVTRSRFMENRKDELICYGGCGVSITNPAHMIRQFLFIQEVNPSKNPSPRRIYHEVFSLGFNEQMVMFNALDLLKNFAQSCCEYYYYEMGFQVIYAIHCSKKDKLHIHFVINTTSYSTGKKRHENNEDFNMRRDLFIRWFSLYYQDALKRFGIVEPIIWMNQWEEG